MLDPSTGFNWETCKPSEMCVFNRQAVDGILEIAISKVIPSANRDYNPIGANVIFLCARYACHFHSAELTVSFLNSAIEKIEMWIQVFFGLFRFVQKVRVIYYLLRIGFRIVINCLFI